MDAKNVVEKIVGFNKDNFEKTYTYITKIQDQVDQKVAEFIDGATLVPEPVRDFYKQWAQTARNSREALKKQVEEGYQGIENYFATKA